MKEELKEELKFMKKALVFGLIFMCLFYLLNLAYLKLILSETVLERTDAQFKENKKDIQLLFMGDSRAKTSFDPTLIEHSFNFGAGGESYILTYYKLKKILEDPDLNLKAITLPFDLHTFSAYRTTEIRDEWYWRKYVDFKELADANPKLSFDQDELKGLFPLIGGGETFIRYLLFGKESIPVTKGHYALKGDFSQTTEKKEWASKTAYVQMANFKLLDEMLLSYFQKTIALAAEKKIKVILIKAPVTEEYYQVALNYLPKPEEYYQKAKDKIEEYGNIYFFDYQNLFFENESLFQSADHLNQEGVKILSQRLKKDLTRLNLFSSEENRASKWEKLNILSNLTLKTAFDK